MIAESIILGVTAIVCGSLWLADRVVNRERLATAERHEPIYFLDRVNKLW